MANINEVKKYHFIYKTTNLLNGKYYVGMHSTANLKDGYLGSGTQLGRAIRKYGKEAFQIKILEFLTDREVLGQREKVIVTEEIIDDPLCMNLKVGGLGGFSPSAKEAFKQMLKDPLYKREYLEKVNEGRQKAREEGRMKNPPGYDWRGKKHKPETIQKMKETKKGHGKGETNSQFGTMHITNGVENSKIKKESVIPEGWYKGKTSKGSFVTTNSKTNLSS